jgi:hypothetical protein
MGYFAVLYQQLWLCTIDIRLNNQIIWDFNQEHHNCFCRKGAVECFKTFIFIIVIFYLTINLESLYVKN